MITDYDLWNSRWDEKQLDCSWVSSVDENFKQHFDNNTYSTALEIGCGHGVNSIYLNNLGCRVDAVDISKFAIEYGKAQSTDVNFIEGDFYEIDFNKQYDFIFDRGFFHGPTDRLKCATRINSLLAPGGIWMSLIGSIDGQTKENKGPPPHTLTDVITVIEPYFKILTVRATTFLNKKTVLSPAWEIVSTVRDI